MEKQNLLEQLGKKLQQRKAVNSLNLGTNELFIDASFEYIKDISIKVCNNALDMVTQINLTVISVDRRIPEETFNIYPHEFDTEAKLLSILFGRITTYNRKTGQEIEALRRQLNLFGDNNE